MTTEPDLNDRAERLMLALKHFGVAPRSSLAAAIESTDPSVIRISRIKVAGQKLIHPDLLIIDPGTGSLGMVYLVTSPLQEHFKLARRRHEADFPGGEVEMLRELMNTCIDEAAHVRQLFLGHPTATTHLAWSVELVFVTSLEANLRHGVGDVFRTTQLETSFLYSIGLNEFVWPQAWDHEDFNDFEEVVLRGFPESEPNGTSLPRDPALDDGSSVWVGEFRRAFAWLLLEVRKWVADANADQNSKNSTKTTRRKLERIQLENFRLPGTRTLQFSYDDGVTPQSPSAVQLVHGPNGSGKSSFVEALEFVVTRRIERLGELDDDDAFRDAIVNHAARKSRQAAGKNAAVAKATLSWSQGRDSVNSPNEVRKSRTTFTFEKRTHSKRIGIKPLDRFAFILDQVLMDRLTNARPADRSEAFLRAFFPNEEIELRKNAHAQRKNLRTAVNDLPEPVRQWLANLESDAPLSEDDLRPEAIVRRLGWLDGSDRAVPRDLMTACVRATLPKIQDVVDLSRLDVLNPAMPSLSHAMGHIQSEISKEQFSGLLSALEGVLNELIPSAPKRRRQIAEAIAVLDGLVGWQVAKKESSTDASFRRDLDEWLDATAAEDLATRQLQIRTVVEKVAELQGVFPGHHPPSLRPIVELSGSRLRSWRDDMQSRAKEAFDKLPRQSSAAESTSETNETGTRPTRLSALQLKALTDVSHDAEFVCQIADGPSTSLGELVSESITSQESRRFGKIEIGEGDWAAELISELKQLDQSLELLDQSNQFRNDRSRTGVSMIARLERVRDEARELDKLDQELQRSFIAQLQRADRPLNELMAMFTPARWAYEDLIVRQQLVDDSLSDRSVESGIAMSVEWRTAGDKADASLKFNTAQLNTRTLAMFLLSGIRMSNSLRLLILDDPFDGMDELTIAAIARGLARLDHIFRQAENDWLLLVFVHSRSAFERLRHEIPGVSHRLPFHVPHHPTVDSNDHKGGNSQVYESRIVAPLRPGSANELAPLTSLLTDLIPPKARSVPNDVGR